MKISKRPAGERGRADHGWLQARFSFSFSQYHDPRHMGFRALRVINNDTIAPGGGFPSHPHDNMEIFTYVIEGQLAHKDSMGNGAVIEAGDLQYMSAGSGVTHSEFNPSSSQQTQLYQVWLLPRERNGEPRYEEKRLADGAGPNTLTLLFSGDGREGSTAIRQDAEIFFGKLDAGKRVSLPVAGELPHAWIQVISGQVSILGEDLRSGDGLAVENHPDAVEIAASGASKLLVFRLS